MLWCVRSPGGGGTIIVPPLLPRLAWLVLTLWCGLEKRVREPVGGQVRGGNGAGQSCPAPCAAGWRCRRCVRVEDRRLRVGVPARSGEHNPTPSLVLAYMETGSHPVGAEQGVSGASGRAWWPGWGRAGCWHTMLASSAHPGGAKLTLLGRGRGALPAVVAISWWLRLLVVALPPLLGAWVMLGRGAFPLVVGWVGGNDFPR